MNRRQALGVLGAAPLMFAPTPPSAFPGMPGRFPGRVVAIEDTKSIVNGQFQANAISIMVREGMMRLTGEKTNERAWKTLFAPGDVVGIKWNPNGMDGLISSRPVLDAILYGLDSAGVRMTDVVVYERYAEILDRIVPWLPRWVKRESAAPKWEREQQNIAGYDPKWFAEVPITLADQRDNSPEIHRSHVALFASQHVTKIINVPVLKHHQAGGVTIALKNMSYGMANNVNRSHDQPNNANRVHELIPAIASMPPIRGKVVLNVVDGLNALCHAGPYGRAKYIWPLQRMYFSTDPVAVDTIGWKVIDEKRVALGLKPVAIAAPDADSWSQFTGRPEHITIAGQKFGLGEWRREKIDFQQVRVG